MELEATPTALEFGALFVGERATKNFLISNQGRISTQAVVEIDSAAFRADATAVSLAPGESRRIGVTYSPVEAADDRGTLGVRAAGADRKIALSGRGVERLFEAEPTLDLGSVRVGESSTLPLQLRSLAALDLELSLELRGSEAFTTGSPKVGLPAGAAIEVPVTFAPAEPWAAHAVLEISACTDCPRARVQLIGEGLGRALRVAPNPIEFGPVAYYVSRSQDVHLRNEGNETIAFAPVELEGSDAFSIATPALVDLAPGESTTLQLRFRPRALGPLQATLHFRADDSRILSSVPVRGDGGGPILSVEPGVLDFGTQPIGRSVERSFLLRNSGQPVPVAIRSVRIEGPDAGVFSVGAFEPDVRDMGSAVPIRFQGERAGTFEARAVVTTNDRWQPHFEVVLAARALAGAGCEIMAIPGVLHFGQVAVNRRDERQVLLVNNGTSECVVWDVGIDPAGSSLFRLATQPADTVVVGPGESLPLVVRFDSQGTNGQLVRGGLRYSYGAFGRQPARVALDAVTTDIRIGTDPSSFAFGQVPVGAASVRRVRVTNESATWLLPGSIALAAGGSSTMHLLPGSTVVPEDFPAGAFFDVDLAFTPTRGGFERSQVELTFDVFEADPDVTRIDAWGEGVACGEDCAWPRAICPDEVTVVARQPATLVGRGVHPLNSSLSCSWRVVAEPDHAGSRIEEPAVCTTEFRPKIVGSYEVELLVHDAQGRADTCTTLVHATPPGGLWIETVWEPAEDVRMLLLHDAAGQSSNREAWTGSGLRCVTAMCHSDAASCTSDDWDAPGRNDDPICWVAAQPTTMYRAPPETLYIEAPAVDHLYHLGIHYNLYYGYPAPPPPYVDASVRIFCGGHLRHSIQDRFLALDELIVVGSIAYDATGACSLAQSSVRIPDL
ncbi:choice-of-anchor D domain-containing protein [Vulgatibacter sp.]|uniref:choice-of-anchor D domain-containing protein n=1 Tax=Vulgatibacter sp. TaxID=1971226 RepID=UPI003565A741